MRKFNVSGSFIVWTSESDEAAATWEGLLGTQIDDPEFHRYMHGACDQGLPLNSDGITCSGDCHQIDPDTHEDEIRDALNNHGQDENDALSYSGSWVGPDDAVLAAMLSARRKKLAELR